MAKFDRHLTTEQLSALLDERQEEISEEDREHLASCPQCQQELAELRLMVRLLHTLPEPTLPRSFALPSGITQITPASVQVPGESNLHIVRSTHNPQRRARAQRTTGRRVLSLLGTLAAVVGILFVLSGFVPPLSPMTASSGSVSSAAPSLSAGSSANGSAASSANAPKASAATEQQDRTPAAEQPRGVQANQNPDTSNAQNVTSIQSAPQQASEENKAPTPVFSLLDSGATGTRIGVGILLFIAGMMGIAIGRGRNREARA